MVTDFRIGDRDVSVDLARGTNARPALDDHAWVDHGVGADLDVRIDVGCGRIDQGDARRHELFVLLLSHEPAYLRQLSSAVNASDFLWIVNENALHQQLAPPVDRHEIGEVVLTLRVLRRDAAEGVEQRREIERVNAAVDLVDLALGRRGVSFFDDARELAIHPDDPPITEGTFDRGRHHSGCGSSTTVNAHQTPQRCRRQKRDIA